MQSRKMNYENELCIIAMATQHKLCILLFETTVYDFNIWLTFMDMRK